VRIHDVLDEIFGSSASVRILRAFFRFPAKEFTELELSRISRVSQPTVHRNIKALAENGILLLRVIGHSNIYNLNRKNPLCQRLSGLFKSEQFLLDELVSDLNAALPNVKSAVLFGSFAEGKERPDSDIDVLVVCDEKLTESCRKSVLPVQQKYGNSISFLFLSESELRAFVKKKKPLITALRSHGVLIKGKPLADICRGE